MLRANFSDLSKEIDEHQTHVTACLNPTIISSEACMNSAGGNTLLPYRHMKRRSTSFLLCKTILNVLKIILKCQKYIIKRGQRAKIKITLALCQQSVTPAVKHVSYVNILSFCRMLPTLQMAQRFFEGLA